MVLGVVCWLLAMSSCWLIGLVPVVVLLLASSEVSMAVTMLLVSVEWVLVSVVWVLVLVVVMFTSGGVPVVAFLSLMSVLRKIGGRLEGGGAA